MLLNVSADHASMVGALVRCWFVGLQSKTSLCRLRLLCTRTGVTTPRQEQVEPIEFRSVNRHTQS